MKLENNYQIETSSFRDPSGFIFRRNEVLYRQVNHIYKEDYDCLIESGLYNALLESELLIPHEEVDVQPIYPDKFYKVIKPELIRFVSYPYEWSFSQLKNAALTTLEIQKIALKFGMTLKDGSAYNIQFKNGKPVLIDTLSFEKYQEGQFWKPYKQFCQHFFAPLSLMSHKDIRLNQLLRIYLDGIPLDLASKLLPLKTRFMFSILTHIHAHAKSQKHFEGKKIKVSNRKLSKNSFIGIIESLYSGIKKLNWTPEGTEWDDDYSDKAFEQKKQIISSFLDKIRPNQVWDLSAKTGEFSRISSNKSIDTISFDIDPAAVEKNYLEVIKKQEKCLLPLILDLTNPTPSIGWNNEERTSFVSRGPVDLILALSLIQNLAISNNLPFYKIVEFLQKNCTSLIIEFIPKTDSQVQQLLASREDIFDSYDRENFENEFKKKFNIIGKSKLENSERILYFMQKRS